MFSFLQMHGSPGQLNNLRWIKWCAIFLGHFGCINRSSCGHEPAQEPHQLHYRVARWRNSRHRRRFWLCCYFPKKRQTRIAIAAMYTYAALTLTMTVIVIDDTYIHYTCIRYRCHVPCTMYHNEQSSAVCTYHLHN